MKKLLFLIGFYLLSTILLGCAPSEEPSPQDPEPLPQVVLLTVNPDEELLWR